MWCRLRQGEAWQAQCPLKRSSALEFGHAVCASSRAPAKPRIGAAVQRSQEHPMALYRRDNRRAERCDEFTLAQVGTRCWLVACNGRLIAGALLSSLRAAVEYAAA